MPIAIIIDPTQDRVAASDPSAYHAVTETMEYLRRAGVAEAVGVFRSGYHLAPCCAARLARPTRSVLSISSLVDSDDSPIGSTQTKPKGKEGEELPCTISDFTDDYNDIIVNLSKNKTVVGHTSLLEVSKSKTFACNDCDGSMILSLAQTFSHISKAMKGSNGGTMGSHCHLIILSLPDKARAVGNIHDYMRTLPGEASRTLLEFPCPVRVHLIMQDSEKSGVEVSDDGEMNGGKRKRECVSEEPTYEKRPRLAVQDLLSSSPHTPGRDTPNSSIPTSQAPSANRECLLLPVSITCLHPPNTAPQQIRRGTLAALEGLFQEYTQIYSPFLCLGHLRCCVRLHPPPPPPAATPAATALPSTLSIIGFLPRHHSALIPCLRTHLLYCTPVSSLDKLPNSSLSSTSPAISSTLYPSVQMPSCRLDPVAALLHTALSKEKSCAVVRISEHHHALLCASSIPISEDDGKTLLKGRRVWAGDNSGRIDVLELKILLHSDTIPGLGPISDLAVLKDVSLAPPPLPPAPQSYTPLPVGYLSSDPRSSEAASSYFASHQQSPLPDAMFQSHLSLHPDHVYGHLLSLASELERPPVDIAQVTQQCERLRLLATLYMSPSLLWNAYEVITNSPVLRGTKGPSGDLRHLRVLAGVLRTGDLNATLPTP